MNELRPDASTEGRISYPIAPSLEDLQTDQLDEAVQSPSISEFDASNGSFMRFVDTNRAQSLSSHGGLDSDPNNYVDLKVADVEVSIEKINSSGLVDAEAAEIENLPELRDSFEYAASDSDGESVDSGFGDGEAAESPDRKTEGFMPEGDLDTGRKPAGNTSGQTDCVIC